MEIIEKNPLLTRRKKCQLRFMEDCMEKDSVIWYLENRDKKYEYKMKDTETLDNH